MLRLRLFLVALFCFALSVPGALIAAPGDLKKALEAKGIKKIAVIPPAEGSNYIMAFLKREGLEPMTKVLTPQEYVNQEVFNPKNYQMAIYANEEKYIQTVKTSGDGDQALVGFANNGGILFLFGKGPTPFYLNEKDVATDSAGMIGMQIVKGTDDKFGTAFGFEKPPEGARLTFSLSKEMKPFAGTLPATFTFPASGDLRWRPVVNRNGSKNYISLISLSDDKGAWLGDAAAYNSGIIYAWYRLTQDDPNRDKIISSLMVFGAKINSTRAGSEGASSMEKLRALAGRFKNIKIAFLPTTESTPIETWLVKSGISYDKLSWTDVVDNKKFNKLNYPVAIYAGGEKYKQTVKVYADVDDALVKYMEGGGFFILTSNLPWPLYMNEENGPTYVVSKLGFPLCGVNEAGSFSQDPKLSGFETPPNGLILNFVVDRKKIPNCSEKISFPGIGDLRWRPFTGSALSESDTYMPIVTLYDIDNNSYGDGIAYVHHKASPPVGGKGMFIWYRAAELMGADSLYYDVFNIVADMSK
ncbi:MAG: hypothetical protein ABII64_00740 [Elusimicrobiota bacterium]